MTDQQKIAERQRQQELDTALTELMGDWYAHEPLGGTIADLMMWSHRQTIHPAGPRTATEETVAGHRQRHQELHRMLDELCAEWAIHHVRVLRGKEPKLFSNTPAKELAEWSRERVGE